MKEFEPAVWPTPTFQVFSRDGQLVGFGTSGSDGCEIYPPGGEHDRYMGSVCGNEVRFSSEELAGRVEAGRLLWSDGSPVGYVGDGAVFDSAGELMAQVIGPATPEEAGGAALLLVFIEWR